MHLQCFIVLSLIYNVSYFLYFYFGTILCIYRSHAKPSFALYTITQDTPNSIAVFSGDGNGNLTFVSRVTSGGNGIPSGSPRGLESQRPIVVQDDYLFAVNTGSGSISMFSIDPYDPTQLTLVDTKPSGGDWPLSVATHGNMACVANGGTSNGIRCYTFSASGLTPLQDSDRSFNLNLTTPPVFHTGPAQIQFVPDGSGVVVSIKSADPPMLLWTINNGALSADSVSTGVLGSVPFGFEFDTDGETLLITDPAPTSDGLSGVGVISVNTGSSPSVSFVGNYTLIPNQHAACWIQRAWSTGNFYVANSASNDISEVSHSTITNAITIVQNYPLESTVFPTDMTVATVGGVEYLFAQSNGQVGLVFRLYGPGKALMQQMVDLQPVTMYGGGVAVYTAQ